MMTTTVECQHHCMDVTVDYVDKLLHHVDVVSGLVASVACSYCVTCPTISICGVQCVCVGGVCMFVSLSILDIVFTVFHIVKNCNLCY